MAPSVILEGYRWVLAVPFLASSLSQGAFRLEEAPGKGAYQLEEAPVKGSRASVRNFFQGLKADVSADV